MTGEERANGRGQIRDLLIVGLIAVLVVVWGGLIYAIVGDRPPDWDYGSHRYVPGESPQSTQPVPQSDEAPRQIELPPPAREPSE